MDYKGITVFWKKGETILKGKVVETHSYKKNQSFKEKGKAALYALYIRLKNGKHVLKNNNEVSVISKNYNE
ncbi:hypothetical protein [Aquimarina agarivorans]|uniref:hypothetical protein n=1 Tax=Aquimarina agarivorans TaxID=980584 RepID=UPI000248F883|nr:hypothetical protein [Aquimarina agarivorans]